MKLVLFKNSSDPEKGSVYIGEQYYDHVKGGTRRRSIKSLGRLKDILARPEGMAWAEEQLELFKQNQLQNEPVFMKSLASYGFGELPFLKIMTDVSMQPVLRTLANNSKLPSFFTKTSCCLVLARCVNPDSELASLPNVEDSVLDYSGITLDNVYETLGLLAKHQDRIIKGLQCSLEESSLKTELDTPMVDLRQPEQLQGHALVGFMALFITRTLEQTLLDKGVKISLTKVRAAFNAISISLSPAKKDSLNITVHRSQVQTVRTIMQALGLPPLVPQASAGIVQKQLTPTWVRFKRLPNTH